MPSFLNKVFGYKKHDDKEPTRQLTDNTLLDGKYEAILPPSDSTFVDSKDSDRDVLGFSLFKPKPRGFSQKSSRKDSAAIPHLTLHLPGPKDKSDSRALGVVFEADPDLLSLLDDSVIAAKRLNPLEALLLIRACALAITERGLETLGIMHPHWFSASPDIQRKLISLFIRSLNPQNRISTLSPTPTSPSSAFENELRYTRLPHDVAAVLRWGLRHLSLENGQFGKDNADWTWYNTFFHAERKASYPPKAFSELLLPQLPAPHVELLTTVLNLISSLAAHAETNSISGSKLSKFLGLWLLVATRAEQSDDWIRFYARWERAGRILEHIFLARLREESFRQRLPTRLQELVKYYPYSKGSPTTEDDLLSRPRFSTRQYDALLVRIESLLPQDAKQPKQHPIQLLLEAFQLPVENAFKDEHTSLWNTLKTTVSGESSTSDPEGLQFSRIFVDETIQVLSLIPAGSNSPMSPTFLTSPITNTMSHKRSSSPVVFERTGSESNVSMPASPTSPSSAAITDWAQFSLSGFGDASVAQPLAPLLEQDDDIEVTQPRLSRKSSRQRGKSRSRRRRSEDREPLDNPPSSQPDHASSTIETKLASVHVVRIDEAFIDFWSDAIVDPISANWPTFVVCGLKQVPSINQSIRWLVIEQTYIRQQSQNSRVPSPDGQRGRSPRPSFKSDISGFRINSVFSSARKRFSLFSKSATDLELKKSGGKSPIAGELGEILVEEETTRTSAADTAVGATATGGTTADVADQLKANEIDVVPVTGTSRMELVSALKEESDAVHVAANVPSVESTPQSGVEASMAGEGAPVEQCPTQTVDGKDQEIDNAADLVAKTTPLVTELPNSQSPQDLNDPTVLTFGPTAENHVTAESQMKAELVRQDIVQDQHVNSVVHPREGDELPAESSGELSTVAQVDVAEDSQGSVEADAGLSPPAAIAVLTPSPAQPADIAIVDDQILEPAGGESHVVDQPSRNTPADLLAAPTVEPGLISQEKIEDLPLPTETDVQAQVLATATPSQPEASITCVVDEPEEAEEIAEQVDVPTPAPERVVLVEETPGPEASVDDACAAHVSASENASVEDAAAAELQATLEADVVEAVPLEIALASDTTTRILAINTEHAADLVSELTTEGQPPVQDIIAHATTVGGSAGNVSVKDVETVPTPVAEAVVLVDDTPSPEPATEVSEVCQVTPAVVPAAEDRPIVQVVGDAEVPPTEAVPLAVEPHPSVEVEPPAQLTVAALAESLPEAAIDEILTVDTPAEPPSITPVEDADAQAQDTSEAVVGTSESAEAAMNPEPVEDDAGASVSEATQAVVNDATLSAVVVEEDDTHPVQSHVNVPSKSVPQDDVTATGAQEISVVDMENEAGSDESKVEIVAQDTEAACPAPDVVEEIVVVVDASEPEVPAAEQVVAEEEQALVEEKSSPVVVSSELQAPETDANVSQDIVDIPAKQPATGDIDSSVQELVVPSEEVVPAES